MTKATETLLALSAVGAVYFALLAKVIPSPQLFHQEILPYLPLWAVVSLGSYSLAVLGYRVFSFKDKPEKYKELLVQIDEAREFYKSKGIDLDE
ncbi:hypothetical protein PSN45_000514 [Yamadazyma tenuis]|uniref:Dolichol-phosphate mannosyltransferase subunit 3 n=1 Tax=Candida tenuis (strain ATCC 10573 / BCRC 21748 / CBS 615 / JCM 9827 / NBRC 10315 / NRRL Y-1498 / VKM Y-70) TaxID=590646 RepID=G3B972_CANTC|nr:uncharacterized protein CANTEDRAFT_115272 [Yamadazyma tenuis ATCC 10573]XP_006688000.1 dolichol-phosphate mannosyltransferase subunit 3 [Yamadazyma tenuis ATCC 10573]EGV61829.1 hypothetical protein CANTEDRAFT_115272 [Yamadazyma tenuis ATCC 10573]EGV61830.1 dolichol-phosphate mannosyltransferase subunit 3 [Yamadazyma tenuis ATCC 10573]WEJ93054.1 hypothetical protein PSN45_000514 [Yamadazyma tenuis]